MSNVVLILSLLLSHTWPVKSMQIHFTNIQHAEGSIYVAVFNRAEAFLQTDRVFAAKVVAVRNTGQLRVELPELPPGTYAISCFHDVNGNGKLDKNLLGIPSEPYGFSNNARPKFRAPNWEEAKFEVRDASTAISIRLEKW